MRNWIQHHLNPLHVYCRLMDMGMRHARALRLASGWAWVYGVFWGPADG